MKPAELFPGFLGRFHVSRDLVVKCSRCLDGLLLSNGLDGDLDLMRRAALPKLIWHVVGDSCLHAGGGVCREADRRLLNPKRLHHQLELVGNGHGSVGTRKLFAAQRARNESARAVTFFDVAAREVEVWSLRRRTQRERSKRRKQKRLVFNYEYRSDGEGTGG